MAKAARASIELFSSTAPADAPLPTEFRIFRAGANHSTKGTKNFTEKSARDVMDTWQEYGNDLSIDYGHAMFSFVSADPAEANKAAGWFHPEVRGGELWASSVTWTPSAAKKLADREYRYVSPAFRHTEDGTVTELLNVALTNIPATKGMTPLLASQLDEDDSQEPPPMKTLLALLSLSADATEAAAVEAVSKMQAREKELLGLCAATSPSEAFGRVAAWKQGAEQTQALATELASIKATSAKAEADGLIKQAVADKKLAPAQVAFASQLGEKDPVMLKAFLSSLTATVVPGRIEQAAGGAAGAALLTPEDIALASILGNDVKKLAETKAALGGRILVSSMKQPTE